ncbi:hypothetical protein NDI54_06185 [Haloarcula sp. S1AR25-5A]|uniref:Uncharacterized protein n=1 Tax=Haloarcula terrestris TaxID=2950533 RepID=A0AAE4JI04_9EURY|nr:hypothetical protein [Haloarcula terrestris]MDS0220939.1 hypothetical protein [Haloarcula terrestris]
MESIGFALVGGGDQIGRRATYLVRSIRQFHPDAPILMTVPHSEDLNCDFSKTGVKITHKSIPDPEYPISIKTEALHQAEQRLDTAWTCFLDTDTLLTSKFNAHENSSAQIRIKPVDIANQYWAMASDTTWHTLYDKFNISPPSEFVKSTVDRKKMRPYWNAGVVLTRVGNLGQQWRDLTVKIRPNIKSPHHADQVALALLSANYDVDPLSENYNYPVHLRAWTIRPKTVLHYHKERWLLSCFKNYGELFDKIGISAEFPFSRFDVRMAELMIRSIGKSIMSQLGWLTWDSAW